MRPPKRINYLDDRFSHQRMQSGLTAEQVKALSDSIYGFLVEIGVKHRSIVSHRLDNPFMQDHARATMLAQVRGALERHPTAKRSATALHWRMEARSYGNNDAEHHVSA